jgi:hypothetical protein
MLSSIATKILCYHNQLISLQEIAFSQQIPCCCYNIMTVVATKDKIVSI